MANPAVVFDGATKIYGHIVSRLKAVDSVSFSVAGGEFVAVLGPNGAGKSTLLRMLTNIVTPTEGSVRVNGYDISEDSRHALDGMGCQVDVRELNTSLTPREFCLKMGLLAGLTSESARSETERVLDVVAMAQWGNSRISKFSKGMKQRICVAQALMGDPQILVMDEPMSGMDPSSAFAISIYLKDLRKRGDHTLVISTHDMSGLEDLCTSMVVLDSGRLVGRADIAELEARESRRTVHVTTSSEFTQAAAEAVGEEDYVSSVERYERGARITVFGNTDTEVRLFRHLVDLGLNMVEVSEEDRIGRMYRDVLEREADVRV